MARPGYVKYEINARGQVVEELERVDPIPGRDVQLTIDLKVQQYAEQILDAGLKEARKRTPKEKPGHLLQGAGRLGRGGGPEHRRDPRHGLVTRRSTTASSSAASATRSTRSSSATTPATRW